jgi:glutathione S-transferase
MLIRLRFYSPTPNEAAVTRYVDQLHRYYGVVERQLEKTGGDSILPGGITSVDVHYEPWVRRPDYIQVSLDEYPFIQRWLRRMSNEKAVQDGYQRIRDSASREDPMAEARGLKSRP